MDGIETRKWYLSYQVVIVHYLSKTTLGVTRLTTRSIVWSIVMRSCDLDWPRETFSYIMVRNAAASGWINRPLLSWVARMRREAFQKERPNTSKKLFIQICPLKKQIKTFLMLINSFKLKNYFWHILWNHIGCFIPFPSSPRSLCAAMTDCGFALSPSSWNMAKSMMTRLLSLRESPSSTVTNTSIRSDVIWGSLRSSILFQTNTYQSLP